MKGISLECYLPEVDTLWEIDRFPIDGVEGAEDLDDVELKKVESNAIAQIKVVVKAPCVSDDALAKLFEQLANVYSGDAEIRRLRLSGGVK